MRVSGKGLINRQNKVNFKFDGVNYTGYEGDSVASALLASGKKLFGRSFKYHRPRGVLTAGSEEPNALITVCLLYTSPSPRDKRQSRMPSSA